MQSRHQYAYSYEGILEKGSTCCHVWLLHVGVVTQRVQRDSEMGEFPVAKDRQGATEIERGFRQAHPACDVVG